MPVAPIAPVAPARNLGRPAAVAVLALLATAACDPGPTGHGAARPGIAQTADDAGIAARRKARQEFYRGPRGGSSGR